MDQLVIEKNQLTDFANHLLKKFEVFAAQKKNGEKVFDKLNNPQDLILDYQTTILPPKQFFLPPREEMFVFDNVKKKLRPQPKHKKIILFGLNWQDLEAMTQLDEIMSKPTFDYYYWQRRNNSIIIGVVKEKDEIPPGGDLVLQELDERHYKGVVLTSAGRKIAKLKFFKKSKVPETSNTSLKKTGLQKLLLDAELIADAVIWSWKSNHKIWDELAEKCLGCAICTYVCPLCYCFTVEDQVSLDGSTCVRYRRWDACTLPNFAKIAGGHSFRKDLKTRYFNWYHHKFVRAYKEYGKAQCVACGRCKKYCPAGIDIEKVLLEILRDFKESRNNK